jgi:hypothetical protein
MYHAINKKMRINVNGTLGRWDRMWHISHLSNYTLEAGYFAGIWATYLVWKVV